MTGPERGFLLLCSHLGDPQRKCLTTAQFRKLYLRMRASEPPGSQRDVTPEDLISLGYDREDAQHIVSLLSEEERLDAYLRQAERAGCHAITRVSPQYPQPLLNRLGADAPGLLWYKGDPKILVSPCIGLVGSRDLLPWNQEFAWEAGHQAARQGYALVSGNARGTDQTGQNSCLRSGGQVISVVADALTAHQETKNVLWLCEDCFDAGFSAQRALSRNRLIHSLGRITLVAQSSFKTGGTWDGSVKNLRFGWTPLYCFDDGRKSTELLAQMGANLLPMDALRDFSVLGQDEIKFL